MTRMTPARVVWLCWCGFWAIAWLLVGFFSFGIGWLGVSFSLLAMLLVLIPSPQRQQVQRAPQSDGCLTQGGEMWSPFVVPFARLGSHSIQRVGQPLRTSRSPFTYFKRLVISINTLKSNRHLDYLRNRSRDMSRHRWIVQPGQPPALEQPARPHAGAEHPRADLRLGHPTTARRDPSPNRSTELICLEAAIVEHAYEHAV